MKWLYIVVEIYDHIPYILATGWSKEEVVDALIYYLDCDREWDDWDWSEYPEDTSVLVRNPDLSSDEKFKIIEDFYTDHQDSNIWLHQTGVTT